MKLRVCCVQMNTGSDRIETLKTVETLIRQAAASGVDFITTPENVDVMVYGKERIQENAYYESQHPSLQFFQELTAVLKIWLLVGSLSIKETEDTLLKRSYLLDPYGQIRAYYDKIHMFDVVLSADEVYKESATYLPGTQAVVANTPWGKLGMTICYDVRFAYLYRTLAQSGAVMLTVPSAFTVPTGQAHWHTLLRTRAIETGCYVIAPAQCGTHNNRRRTYGHSLIVDPWGTILAEGGEEPGLISTVLDLDRVMEVRRKIPSHQHDRPFTLLDSEEPQ